MGQSLTDVEDAVKVETSVTSYIITERSHKFLCLGRESKQRNNNQWRLIESETPVAFIVIHKLRESLMNEKIQTLDSFSTNQNNDRGNYWLISFAFCPGKGLKNNLKEV